MTVGELIEQLKQFDPNLTVERYVPETLASYELSGAHKVKKYVHTAEFNERERIRFEEAHAQGYHIVSPAMDWDSFKNWEMSDQDIVIIS